MKIRTLALGLALPLAAALGLSAVWAQSGPRVIQIPQPTPARLSPVTSVRPMPTEAPTRAAGSLVCIDPGHPSETSAGANANGLSENTLNWQVARELAPLLRARGINCVLTKNSLHEKVTNRRRAEIANGGNAYGRAAQLFIRLHCDVGGNRGYTWYYPDRSGTKYGVTGPPREVQIESARAASILNSAMAPVLKGYLKSNPVKTDASTFVGGKQGGVLTGSIFSRVPTALIEMCYINQRADAHFINSESGRRLMAQALAVGIESYLSR